MDSKIFLCLLGLAVCALASPGPRPGDDKPTENPPSTDAKVGLSEFQLAKKRVCIDGRAEEEVNKKLVREVLLKVFNDRDFSDVDRYFFPDYIEHNPNNTGGVKALKEEVPAWLETIPKGQVDIRKLHAAGDYVWVHSKFPEANNPGKFVAIMDCFRMQNGLIMEHWGVMQSIPELKDSKNPHPMF